MQLFKVIILLTSFYQTLSQGPPPGVYGEDGAPPFLQQIEEGQCPYMSVVKKFNAHAYLGLWYEQFRFPAPFQNGDCVTANYSLFPNGSISVLNQDNTGTSASGVADFGPDKTVASLFVSFQPIDGQESFNTGNSDPNYNVIATDYTNYAVVYSCTPIGPSNHFELSWILGREPELDVSFLDNLKEWLGKVKGLKTDKYRKTNQKNCT